MDTNFAVILALEILREKAVLNEEKHIKESIVRKHRNEFDLVGLCRPIQSCQTGTLYLIIAKSNP